MFPFYETSLLYSRSRGSAPASSGAGGRDSSAPGSGSSSASQQQQQGSASSAGSATVNSGGSGGPVNNAGSGSVPIERDSFSRWRDRHYFGPRRWFSSSLRDESSWEKDSPATGMCSSNNTL